MTYVSFFIQNFKEKNMFWRGGIIITTSPKHGFRIFSLKKARLVHQLVKKKCGKEKKNEIGTQLQIFIDKNV